MLKMRVALKLTPHKEKEFIQTMSSLQECKSEVTGLRDLKWYQDEADGTSFGVVYEWEKEKDMVNYLDMEHFKVFGGAINVLCIPSETTFDISNAEGARLCTSHCIDDAHLENPWRQVTSTIMRTLKE